MDKKLAKELTKGIGFMSNFWERKKKVLNPILDEQSDGYIMVVKDHIAFLDDCFDDIYKECVQTDVYKNMSFQQKKNIHNDVIQVIDEIEKKDHVKVPTPTCLFTLLLAKINTVNPMHAAGSFLSLFPIYYESVFPDKI